MIFNLDRLTKHIALIIVVVSAVIMSYIIYDLSITKRKVAITMVEKVMNEAHHELENEFFPIRDQLITTATQLRYKDFYALDSTQLNQLFIPVIKYFPQVSSLGIATDDGYEYDIIRLDSNKWRSRTLNFFKWGEHEVWAAFRLKDHRKIVLDSTWTTDSYEDPRSRPWFVGVSTNRTTKEVFWTDPYLSQLNGKMGITVSTSWLNYTGDTSRIVLAYDLDLELLNEFTQNLKPTKNGEIMIISDDTATVIGLPPKTGGLVDDAIPTLYKTQRIQEKELLHVIEEAKNDQPFKFTWEGQSWWGAIRAFPLNETQSFKVVIALPENDFLAELNESQRLMAGGFVGILILSLLILRSHNRQRKQKRLLKLQNKEILTTSELLKEKNAEIVDSINYAKRIQKAILPPFKLVNSFLNNSFVLYLPKDIVAGDFYWMEHTDKNILFAAADCTGHGVPGAMVSVMCHNALNRCVREFKLIKPSEILDKSRELVIEEFSKSESQMKDGMDISLCVLNKETKELTWAGANNPLWIIRANSEEVEEYKPDKQPIGNYISTHPFTLHETTLKEGDAIYIFTDGLQDQFGGRRNKKFKPSRLRELLLSIQDKHMEEQRVLIREAFEKWKGINEQVDDICMIGVKV